MYKELIKLNYILFLIIDAASCLLRQLYVA